MHAMVREFGPAGGNRSRDAVVQGIQMADALWLSQAELPHREAEPPLMRLIAQTLYRHEVVQESVSTLAQSADIHARIFSGDGPLQALSAWAPELGEAIASIRSRDPDILIREGRHRLPSTVALFPVAVLANAAANAKASGQQRTADDYLELAAGIAERHSSRLGDTARVTLPLLLDRVDRLPGDPRGNERARVIAEAQRYARRLRSMSISTDASPFSLITAHHWCKAFLDRYHMGASAGSLARENQRLVSIGVTGVEAYRVLSNARSVLTFLEYSLTPRHAGVRELRRLLYPMRAVH